MSDFSLGAHTYQQCALDKLFQSLAPSHSWTYRTLNPQKGYTSIRSSELFMVISTIMLDKLQRANGTAQGPDYPKALTKASVERDRKRDRERDKQRETNREREREEGRETK